MNNLTHTDQSGRPAGALVPALALGVSTAVATWILWFVLHLPSLGTPPALAAPLIGGAWLAASVVLCRRWGVHLREAALGGLFASLLGLLLLGSMLVRPAAPQGFDSGASAFRAGAVLVALAFVAGGSALSALGCILSGGGRAGASAGPALVWRARLAWAVAASFVPLLLIGGVVTSTESGMAVHDWPSTFGANMFLYPQELMRQQPRVYFEHSHRLFGSLVGLCTLTLWVTTLAGRSTRGRYGVWATALFLAVCLQGYVGGQRVLLNNPYLGALHGAFAQVLFAFAGTLALWMSPSFVDLPKLEKAHTRRVRVFATAALHATFVQLVLGAMYRHLRRGDNPGASHILWTHIAFSLVVVALAVIAGSLLIRAGRGGGESLPRGVARRLRRLGAALHGVVGLQFAIGWAALLMVMTGADRGGVPTTEGLSSAPPVPVGEVVAGTAHQANGALLVLVLMLSWAWARRVHRAASA